MGARNVMLPYVDGSATGEDESDGFPNSINDKNRRFDLCGIIVSNENKRLHYEHNYLP